MKISLCMIVKNEERFIEKCLQSALELADEAIIVDTGSTDATISIIESKFTDKAKLYHHTWNNDFSEARNISLQHASGDWILIMDADERLICDAIKVRELLSNGKQSGYNIPIYNFIDAKTTVFSSAMVRLFPNINPKYQGAIHEQLILNGEKIFHRETLDEKICKLVHYGYSIVTFVKKDKQKRNTDIIKAELKKNPKHPFNWYNLGVMNMSKGAYEEALDCFIKAHNLCRNKRYEFHNDLILRMAECLFRVKNYKLCNNFLLSALKDEVIQKYPDYHYYLGLSYRKLNEPIKSVEAFEKCIEIGDVSEGISVRGTGSFLARIQIAQILSELGMLSDAINQYMEAVFDPKNFTKHGLDEFIELLKKNGLTEILNELLNLTSKGS